jgi:hypothetical protein
MTVTEVKRERFGLICVAVIKRDPNEQVVRDVTDVGVVIRLRLVGLPLCLSHQRRKVEFRKFQIDVLFIHLGVRTDFKSG